jgi:hypothetical protein
MPDLLLVSLSDAIAELRREQVQRGRVYPRLIHSGALTKQAAERQNERLAAAIRFLEQQKDFG